jgi:hypothetical protein
MLDDCRASLQPSVTIVPMMLVLFFGAVEIFSGVAVDRRTMRVARTLADLKQKAAQERGLFYLGGRHLRQTISCARAFEKPSRTKFA